MVGNAEQGVAEAHDHPTARGRSPIERAVRTHLGRKIHHGTFCDGFCRRYMRSEEHTSELQSHSDLVCRLLLEKKKKKRETYTPLAQRCIATNRDNSAV